ncbi:MAG: hypothetical protein ACYCUG_17330 [Acidimicrobiales bacterium]
MASGEEEESHLAWGVLGQLASLSTSHPAGVSLAELTAGLDPEPDPLHVGERLPHQRRSLHLAAAAELGEAGRLHTPEW